MNPTEAYKFCPKCGRKFNNFNHEENALVCSSCNFHFYINSAACAGIFIENENNEILLTKRARNPGKDLWSIPGGFVIPDEDIIDAAVREAKEELGVTIKPIKLLNSVHDRYPYQNILVPLVCINVSAKIVEGEIIVGDDVSEYKFFAPQDIPYNQIWSPAIVSCLKEYLEQKND